MEGGVTVKAVCIQSGATSLPSGLQGVFILLTYLERRRCRQHLRICLIDGLPVHFREQRIPRGRPGRQISKRTAGPMQIPVWREELFVVGWVKRARRIQRAGSWH